MCKIGLKPTCCSSAVIRQTHASRASMCRMRWDVRGVWLWVGERAVMLLYDTHGDTHMHARTHADGRDGELSKESPPSQHPPYGRWLTAGRDRDVRARACVYTHALHRLSSDGVTWQIFHLYQQSPPPPFSIIVDPHARMRTSKLHLDRFLITGYLYDPIVGRRLN